MAVVESPCLSETMELDYDRSASQTFCSDMSLQSNHDSCTSVNCLYKRYIVWPPIVVIYVAKSEFQLEDVNRVLQDRGYSDFNLQGLPDSIVLILFKPSIVGCAHAAMLHDEFPSNKPCEDPLGEGYCDLGGNCCDFEEDGEAMKKRCELTGALGWDDFEGYLATNHDLMELRMNYNLSKDSIKWRMKTAGDVEALLWNR